MTSSFTTIYNGFTGNGGLFMENRPRRHPQRVIFKSGDCNIMKSSISRKGIRFIQDIFTTIVDIQWRWTFLIMILTYLISWLVFSLIWWLIMFTHGDLEPEHLPMYQAENGWVPCVLNIHNWTSCFLWSVETQTTIGYGLRVITEECPEAIFMTCCQSIAGMSIQTILVGLVFAKMIKPKTVTVIFSKNAVICLRDGTLCLMFRVGDMRKSEIIGGTIQAQFVRPKNTNDGEIINNYCTKLEVTVDDCDNNLFFIWPLIVVHKINENSPLYHMNANDIGKDNFEILVVLEGTVHSTGQSMQARSSYLPKEILWGHRFEPILHFNKKKLIYEVNCEKFDDTYPIDMAPLSAEELNHYQNSNNYNIYETLKPPQEYEDLTSSLL